MDTKKIASLAAACLAAGTIATAGCASAATVARTVAAAPAAAPASGAAHANGAAHASGAAQAGAGAAHLVAYSINSDGPYFRAIVTGAVGGYGPAVTVHPDGTVDPEHTSELKLRLAHGAFRLSIAALDRAIVRAFQHWPHNQATCSGSITASAPAPVVTGSGTGGYRGIIGAFTLTATIDEVDVKPACNGTSKFLAQVIFLAGTGHVSY